MRIYISGPMTGEKDYRKKFQEAAEYVRQEYGDVDIINPAEALAPLPGNMKWHQYMDITLNMLRGCDAIFLMDGWERSKGAQIERLYAEGCGMVFMFQGGTRFHRKDNTFPHW